jgi:serine/threonine protein kinase
MERFEVVRRIGKGSFGEAHLVRDKEHGNTMRVIKTVDLSALEEGEQQAALRECALLQAYSSSGHPNVVQYVDAFTAEGVLHIVMEYCAGGDLAKRVATLKKARAALAEATDRAAAEEAVAREACLLDDDAELSAERVRSALAYPGFSEDVVTEWAAQLFLALDNLHRDRIVHRDIKLSNIFRTLAPGWVRLGLVRWDWGW